MTAKVPVEADAERKPVAYQYELRFHEGEAWGEWRTYFGRRLPIIADDGAEVRNPVPLYYAADVPTYEAADPPGLNGG